MNLRNISILPVAVPADRTTSGRPAVDRSSPTFFYGPSLADQFCGRNIPALNIAVFSLSM
jgi:hypothetical protein